jgi:tRNA dimethylallyltransferase
MLAKDQRIVAIVGPTCTGKSDLAMSIAMELGGEIVNADAMQVYRHFDIGTAKPDATERKKIAHHLIDIVEPWEHFNAARFREKADEVIEEIWQRRKTPIVVGGTGLYVRALLYGLFEVSDDTTLRARLQNRFDADPDSLYRELEAVDPQYAGRISSRDKVRVVRALEIFHSTGRPMSEWERDHGFREARFKALVIGLTRPRQTLYQRINERVETMLARGWVEEVKDLMARGFAPDLRPFSGIGYREIVLYIQGLLSYEVMVEEIKKKTRRYAKRQTTWFSKEKDLRSFLYPEEMKRIAAEVTQFLK